MRVNFEEKTYENYFNAELNNCTDIFFPIGQVQEGFFGFDTSAFSINRNLWRIVGFPFRFSPVFRGVELREVAHEMERSLEMSISQIPRMKANLLFQYKRPQYIKSKSGKEWKHWNNPYYRYDIYQKQQTLLNEIDSKFEGNVLIVYASPAIRNIDDLVEKKIKNQIIANSNFKRSSSLNNHGRNTYTSFGNFSIACSKPEKIENLDLIKILENLDQKNYNNFQSNKEFIINFQKQISSIIEENPLYTESFVKLKNEFNEKFFRGNKLLYSFLVMHIFNQLTGVQWLIKL